MFLKYSMTIHISPPSLPYIYFFFSFLALCEIAYPVHTIKQKYTFYCNYMYIGTYIGTLEGSNKLILPLLLPTAVSLSSSLLLALLLLPPVVVIFDVPMDRSLLKWHSRSSDFSLPFLLLC